MQHLILAAVVLVIVTLLFVRRSVGFDKATTLSLHIASQRRVRVIYAVLLTTAVGLIGLHALLWLRPHLTLGPLFDIGLSFAMISVLLAVWIPDVPGWRRRVHYGASYGILGSFIITSLSLVLADITPVVRVSAAVVLTSECVMVAMFFWAPKARRHFLLYQGIYIFGFLLLLLLITYI